LKTLILTLFLLVAAGARSEALEVRVVEVEDGDTLLVMLKGEPTRIQLAGIDAPEDRPNPKFNLDLKRTGLPAETLLALGRHATAHLRGLAPPGTTVVLAGDLAARDKYGRIALEVKLPDGRSLNEAMVADGYARALHAPAYVPLQEEAMKSGKGIWGQAPEAARKWAESGGAPRGRSL